MRDFIIFFIKYMNKHPEGYIYIYIYLVFSILAYIVVESVVPIIFIWIFIISINFLGNL